jgi:hypothetical protein
VFFWRLGRTGDAQAQAKESLSEGSVKGKPDHLSKKRVLLATKRLHL